MPKPKVGYYFVPFPCEIWDKDIDFSFAEFRLMGYLLRHQIRLGKPAIAITKDELLNGRWGPADGAGKRRRWDRGCRLTRKPLNAALDALEGRGWIEIEDVSENPNIPKLAIRVTIVDPGEPEGPIEESGGGETPVESGETPPGGGESDAARGESPASAWRNSTSDGRNSTPSIRRVDGEVDGKEDRPLENTAARSRGLTMMDRDSSLNRKAREVLRQSIFPYYISMIRPEYNQVYTLTEKRMEQGVKRLLECLKKAKGNWEIAENLMKVAINTMADSDWHMGENPSQKRYNDWELLFRSEEKLEWWLVQSGEKRNEERKSSRY